MSLLFKSFSGSHGGPPSVKDVDPKGRTVTGFFSSFNTLDSDGDIIRPGAYAKTIAEWGPKGKNRIWHLDQHRVNQRINKPSVLEEKEEGLYFETVFPETQLASDLLTLYDCGAITEHSVGLTIVQARPVELETEADGQVTARELTELKCWEGSTVTWGANENTPATGIKSASQTPDALKEHISIMRSVLREGVSDAMAERLELALNVMETDLAHLEAKHNYQTVRGAQKDGIDWGAVDRAFQTLMQAKQRALDLRPSESGDALDTEKDEPHAGEELLKHFIRRCESA